MREAAETSAQIPQVTAPPFGTDPAGKPSRTVELFKPVLNLVDIVEFESAGEDDDRQAFHSFPVLDGGRRDPEFFREFSAGE